ncbi:transducin/WD40 repeat-like superfamily protein [Actinidia rufa]|uniref:Transducin/WD40 repeat-like superfamily protein n=1 Tax=Actinidia rufa TaxID=165716 RepID=A0A7J0DIT4_9ERIC|nr:transducin/WD40 repeat-like superfamily protein [Actinidia rufa]
MKTKKKRLLQYGINVLGVHCRGPIFVKTMSNQQGDDAEYVADEYEMEDVDDDMDEEFVGREMGGSDSDVDEYDHMNNRMADTSAAQARRGKDIQGIPWERLSITREKYRQTRLEQYKNYENIPQSGEGSEKECNITKKGGMYYEFRRNSRSVKSTILHFQLRNLVWATSKHDVYLMSHFQVVHWSSLTCNKSEVLNVSGHVAPCEKHPGSLLEGFSQTQVSTLAVKDRLLVAGGFQGELICKYLDRPGVSFCTRTTYDDNAITNAVEIYSTSSGASHFTASNNDCGVRDFDMEKFQLSKHFRFPWPVNHTSLSPDGKLLVIVGDNPDGLLVDASTGKTVMHLVGHLDFSFASAWHPDGLTFTTGNQDKTCRIWDVRNLSKSVAALKGNLGAIRSIRYTSDGQFMAMAEPADFVHVYDVKGGYEKEQEIDFFGEISGMSFSPDTESLFIGVWDRTYGSLLEFGRQRNYSYLDSVI